MHTTLLDIFPGKEAEGGIQVALSFAPFVNFLKTRREKENVHKNHFFNYVIDQFEQRPELMKEIDPKDVHNYNKQLQLIYASVSPVVEDEDAQYWALVTPGCPVVFYSTNAFFKLATDKQKSTSLSDSFVTDNEELKLGNQQLVYSYILERFYNVPSFFNREMVKHIDDKETGTIKYFKINPDLRFVDVQALKPLPKLDMSWFQSRKYEKEYILEKLREVLPLSMFRMEGFGITNAKEVTASYALESMKNMLLSHASDDAIVYEKFSQVLKTLIGRSDIEFGALPFLQVNNKLVFKDNACLNSMLQNTMENPARVEEAYIKIAERFFKDPEITFFNKITDEDQKNQEYLRLVKKAGIYSFALIPVFFNNLLVGLLEVYCKKEDVFTEDLLSRLDPAIPLISQLMKNTVDEFNLGLTKVVRDKFTALQPSVQWKFNEVAWHYLRDVNEKVSNPEIGDIIFENVYPLYGAVDIRNSTIERNAALYKDMQVQFAILIKTLHELKERSGFGLIDEKIFVSQQWLNCIANVSEFNDEVRLNDFLENDITPFLIQFTESNNGYKAVTEKYFDAIDDKTGKAYHNRRQLERSMNTVISSLNNYFEMLKNEIQNAYPCYFEKFRTDGVEYDIYIGQSITPDKPYNDIYLKNLRLMQLTSMATVAKYSHSLLPHLPRNVETTQLIFIHSHPIDIRFRKDEKRFDVEGAYNIRYHIIKKRIDKVHIRDSNERLTQPNKIALIYFNQKEADEYISYIHYLQGERMLADDLEHLELEDLQGVSGLKALRVGVMVE